MIKAIETVYNGYKFRSRLEARWAVFFDALGIEYQYEPEGFDLGEAGWYLPDFWLPNDDWFVEVKPNDQISEQDLKKTHALDSAINLPEPYQKSMGIIILTGIPEPPIIHGPLHPGREWNDTGYLIVRGIGNYEPTEETYHAFCKAVKAAKQARFEHR